MEEIPQRSLTGDCLHPGSARVCQLTRLAYQISDLGLRVAIPMIWHNPCAVLFCFPAALQPWCFSFVRGELHQPLVLERRGGLAQPKNLMYNSLLRGLALTHLATRSTIGAEAYRQSETAWKSCMLSVLRSVALLSQVRSTCRIRKRH